MIYLYIAIDQEVYFIRAYAKSRQSGLTADEKREIAAIVQQIHEAD